MATIINADTSDGLKLTSDTSGQLELQSAGSTKVTVDTSGNMTVTGNIEGTWAGTSGSSAGALAGIPQVVTIERGGVGIASTGLAFGNGSTGNGMRMPYAGKITVATLHCTDLNGTWSAYIEKNGTTNSSYALSATASTADAGQTQVFSTPFTFAAGDAINWQQQAVPTGNTTAVISFWVVFD